MYFPAPKKQEPIMAFSVKRTAGGLVPPSKTTPTGGTLHLSAIDRLPALRCYARTLHVFRHGPAEVATLIKHALSKALVPYYPLAGRLKESSSLGGVQVACTGEGVWFVEAFADCGLDAVNYFDNVYKVPHDDLLPDFVPQTHALAMNPLVLMQVTQFKCNGFVMGLIFCHSICDGLGAAQFLNAIGEMARGLQHPSIAPVWHREALPSPPPPTGVARDDPNLPSPPPFPSLPDYQLEHASIDVTLDRINQLKLEFSELTGGRRCSTFEVVAATMWRCRTRALNFKGDTKVDLVFFANVRHLLHPPLPDGYYGNCFFPVTVTTNCETVSRASNAEVVKLIQEAKAQLRVQFTKWMKGDDAGEGMDPFAPPLAYTTLFISEWGRLGFNQVDYGWGPPVHMVPIQGSSIIPVAIIGCPPTPRKGVRLMTWSVQGVHLPQLLDQMSRR
ncbi:PREDICTED: 3'-N-debenzoyl-2'-deoxytaxol N-benzoyltransferase-like [Nelumbo nucifera]|uniref:Uncharacterized protein n=2 Tax=Nelumbo nucifera TaxID=4432 RepID=A0A822Z4R3_NELNU|nr:PREDICTED: 3'-N-debenzoyl-2'-deoxytaxol N-benzoyltransferase-like [Nelumbo nucifera]DAD38455.1 TPA_asm: hypothetical protein HUJ06_009096 [Nelumbo nucifera]